MSDRSVPVFNQRRGLGGQVAQQLIQQVQTITPDVWQMMDERDSSLIEQELLHGAVSSKYVYSFPIAGSREPVTGISVVGARELASHYGGIRHTLVASISKVGSLFVMKSYPHNGVPIGLYVQHIKELEGEPDFYEVLAEIEDVKTGNRVQVEKREYRMEKRSRAALARDPNLPEEFERPHYQTIAGSKAYRNGVLGVIPQHVQLQWKEKMLRAGNAEVISASEIDKKRAGVLHYAASKAIAIDREAVEELTFDQISGLSEAARAGKEAFAASGEALGIVATPARVVEEPSRQTRAVPSAPEPKRRAPPPPPPPPEDIEHEVEEAEEQFDIGKPSEPTTIKLSDMVPDLELANAVAAELGEDPDGPYEGIYAYDEDNETVLDETGHVWRFTDNKEFALWYVEYLRSSHKPEAVKQNNKAALHEAMGDAVASAILEPPPEQPRRRQQTATVSPLFIKTELNPNGGTNWVHFGNATIRKLAEVWDPQMLTEFEAINRATYVGSSFEKRVNTLLTARRTVLTNTQDPVMRDALALVRDMFAVTTLDDLKKLTDNPGNKAFVQTVRQTRHDDIALMLDAALKAATAKLRPSPSLLER